MESSPYPLVSETQAILGSAPLAPSGEIDWVTQVQQLSAACHRHMLAIGDSNAIEAAAHAISGFQLIKLLSASSQSQPEWIYVIEEQLCRYGAIWIHSLLINKGYHNSEYLRQGLVLLTRLGEIHADSVPWIQGYRSDLSLLLRNATYEEFQDARFVVVGSGNAIAIPLALGLLRALPKARHYCCPSVQQATPAELKRLHQRVSNADVLVMVAAQPAPGSEIASGSETLRSLLPHHSKALTVPSFHYDGHHPWIGFSWDPDGRLSSIEPESPLGAYHDFLAMAAIRESLDLGSLFQVPCPDAVQQRLRLLHLASIDHLTVHEASCDFSISDWIVCRHQLEPIVHALDHPTSSLWDEILRRTLSNLGCQAGSAALIDDQLLCPGSITLPIHPWVRQSLQLDAWAETWGQFEGRPWLIHDQLEASLAFYRRHPWILDINSQHPKLLLAAELLCEQSRQIAITQQAAETVTVQSLARPSIAALINYFDDEDMLAWQVRSGCLDAYDKIYIWDGPYSYTQQHNLVSSDPSCLSESDVGRVLLSDPRVIYCSGAWENEGVKRCEMYSAVQEDLAVIHDTDEFFLLDHSSILSFWESRYHVASVSLQNLVGGGFYWSPTPELLTAFDQLPHRRLMFRRSSITSDQHLDYLWLIGVNQHQVNQDVVCPEPLGHSYHLTACRSAKGQAAKMSFYISLSLSQSGPTPALSRLNELVHDGCLSPEEARLIVVRGDPGFVGLPNPVLGHNMQARLRDPQFCEDMLRAILADSIQANFGEYVLIECYPMQLWFPATGGDQKIRLEPADQARIIVTIWRWNLCQPAEKLVSVEGGELSVELQLPCCEALIGYQVQIIIVPKESQPFCRTLSVQPA